MIHVATVEILMRFEETDAYDHVDLYQQDAITLILHQSAHCLIVSHRYYRPLTGKQDPINHNSSSTKPIRSWEADITPTYCTSFKTNSCKVLEAKDLYRFSLFADEKNLVMDFHPLV